MRLSNRRDFVASSILAFPAAAALFGQQTKPKGSSAVPEESGTVFHSDTFVVVCHTTVVDRNGRLITDLPAGAFTAYENDVQQPIKAVKLRA